MQKKYELIADDCVFAGARRLFRIRAVRDFGDVKRGDLGGHIQSEAKLSHSGNCWVYDAGQVYGDFAVVQDNGKVRGCAWVMGCVEGDAVVDDLAIVCEGARLGGREILRYDDVARGPVPARHLVRYAHQLGKRRELALVW